MLGFWVQLMCGCFCEIAIGLIIWEDHCLLRYLTLRYLYHFFSLTSGLASHDVAIEVRIFHNTSHLPYRSTEYGIFSFFGGRKNSSPLIAIPYIDRVLKKDTKKAKTNTKLGFSSQEWVLASDWAMITAWKFQSPSFPDLLPRASFGGRIRTREFLLLLVAFVVMLMWN